MIFHHVIRSYFSRTLSRDRSWALGVRPLAFFVDFCRKATEGLKLPFGGGGGGGLDGSVAATIFAVTDSLPSKSVGEAVQTITEKEIKSEVEVSQNTILCTCARLQFLCCFDCFAGCSVGIMFCYANRPRCNCCCFEVKTLVEKGLPYQRSPSSSCCFSSIGGRHRRTTTIAAVSDIEC